MDFVEIEKIIVAKGVPKWRRFFSYICKIWQSLAGCSYLIFGGGTLFHARNGSPINLSMITVIVIMARLRNMRIYALGVGVAELPAGLPQFLMRIILHLSDDFAVRDRSSLWHCQQLVTADKLRLTGDLVFALPLRALSQSSYSRVLGVTLAASDIGSDGIRHEAFINTFSSSLKCLSDQGWTIRFLSFQELAIPGVNLSDSALFETLSRDAPGLKGSIIRISSDPAEIARQFSEINVVAGMRFHGLVIAALLGKPFVGVGRDSKLSDLSTMLDMPFINMNDFREIELVEAVEKVRDSIPNPLTVQALARQADENFNKLRGSFS